ncbi:MAG TPA: hypothetical protein VFJ61_04630 [Solirubrobacterales bacterium]|nr:hypothetical protein [Solirubrobacterales bacterium]
MDSALDEVATAVEAAAQDQRRVARRARLMQRRRERGWSWAKVLEAEGSPGSAELLRSSARRVIASTGLLTATLARHLHAEGATHRTIARWLGVSHQRVGALLRGRRSASDSEY